MTASADNRSERHRRHLSLPAELLVLLSSNFPVGAFAYSQGLEQACERGEVKDLEALNDWLLCSLGHGALRNDLIFLSLAMRAGTFNELDELNDLALAMQPSRERYEETVVLGGNFYLAYLESWQARAPHANFSRGRATSLKPALPIACAIACSDYGTAPRDALIAYAIASVGNLTSAAIRLGILGQTEGQEVQARLMPGIYEKCRDYAGATLADLGTATFGADMMGLLHETQRTRLFRS